MKTAKQKHKERLAKKELCPKCHGKAFMLQRTKSGKKLYLRCRMCHGEMKRKNYEYQSL
jgi:Zn finger protein HypA/HybF involved in hydrogenase expression